MASHVLLSYFMIMHDKAIFDLVQMMSVLFFACTWLVDGLEELLQCLEKSKTVKFKYDDKFDKYGTLEIFQDEKKSLMDRMRSIKLPTKKE